MTGRMVTYMKTKAIVLALIGTITISMADGSTIFKRCAVCHGENGEKKSLGVSEVIAGWKEDKTVERLMGYRSKRLDHYGFGNMMYGQATKLNDKEIHEVARYISKLAVPVSDVEENSTSDVTLTPEQIAYKQFIREYFIANPRYGNIREAKRLWEEKQSTVK